MCCGVSRVPRVCVVLESYHPIVGGTERQARILLEGLVRRKLPAFVVTLRSRPELPEREVIDGVAVHRPVRGRSRWKAVIPLLAYLHRIRAQYDILYVQGFRALGLSALPLRALYGKRVIVRAANNGELSGEFFDPALARLGMRHDRFPVRTLNAARKAVLRRSDRFVAISTVIHEEFAAAGVERHRIVMIPNSVATHRFRPPVPGEKALLREELGLPITAFVVCFCARLVRYKGALTLLEAWQRLLAEWAHLNPGARAPVLLYLGAGGTDLDNCEEEARAQATAAGLDGSVRFLGDVTNVELYLRAADIFTLPTANDAFGIAVLEAMATGLPVITTQVGGLADFAHHEENALIVEPYDVDGLHAALVRLVRDVRLRGSLGSAAVQTAQRLSPERVVDAHVALFESLAHE